MEIKIGVQQTAREIVLESDQTPQDVDAAVRAAIADGGILPFFIKCAIMRGDASGNI